MISSKLVLIVPILLAAVLSEDQLTCQEFVLMEEIPVGLATEISLIFIPSLLALLAVSFVSIFAYKLQLRLNREKQTTVNLPPPPPANAIQLETRNSAEMRQTGRNVRNDIEGLEMEESQPKQPHSQNNVDRNETSQSADFRVHFRGEESPAASSNTCFQTVSMLVERIMMLNIAALILVLINELYSIVFHRNQREM